MVMLISLAAILVTYTLLFLLRNTLSLFWSATLFYVATMLYLFYGFDPPVPASVNVMFLSTLLIAVLLYVSSSEEGRQEFFGPILAVLSEDRLWIQRWIVVFAVPGLIAWQTLEASLPSMTPPPKTRSVHPPPPGKITVNAVGDEKPVSVDLMKDDNPLRALESSDPEKFAAAVRRGKAVYYQNCYYCHGDMLAADGLFAEALRPTPANFLDPGNLPMLTETFVYWRVAKGGPGMPAAGTPWDSSMPVWEDFLSQEDMWAVIIFLYDFTGFQPRAKENIAEGH